MDDQTPLHHPTLNCTLIGKPSPSTIEYRGLKYASIPARWKESSPNDTLSPTTNGIYNATQFGPSCPQKRGAQAWDLTLVGNTSLPCEQSQGDGEVMHEFECLTVNVTVPRHTKSHGNGNRNTIKSKKLPVFVWVHGGGLSMGTNSWPQYSLAAFVAHSASIGKPVIAVSVNYRVGVLGFLASRELGVDGNLGFKDVANATRWVRRHVGGFGGDAAQVTAAGESAGGIVLSTLMCSREQGLWDRVVVMSGDVTLRKPRAWAWHEELYGEQIKMLGLDGLGKEERIRRLREWDAEAMCQKLPLAQHFCALVDGRWFKEPVDLAVLEDGRRWEHKPGWCREFAVGNTAHDGTILKGRILDNPSAVSLLHTLCTRHLTPSESHTLLSAYNLLPPSISTATSSPPAPSDPQQTIYALLTLVSELRFHLPTLCAHHGWLTTTPPHRSSTRYAFHISNPFPGPFQNLSSHELDVTFLLQNWNHLLSSKQQSAAQDMASAFVRFTYGEGMGEEGKVTVFTDDGVEWLSGEAYDERFRGGREKVLRGIDAVKLWRVAEGWQQVRPDEEEKGRGRAKL